VPLREKTLWRLAYESAARADEVLALNIEDLTWTTSAARSPARAAPSAGSTGTLSGGEQQMVAIGRALMSDPSVLLLDEPSLGLAPQFVSLIMRTIGQLRSNGRTVVLVEQNAKAALRLADRAYLLETGTVHLEGQAGQLARDPRVVAVYLGGSDEDAAAQPHGSADGLRVLPPGRRSYQSEESADEQRCLRDGRVDAHNAGCRRSCRLCAQRG
jgi:ABC-type multidrug transport system ATPase subunit